MSGTITTDLLDKLPVILGMREPKVVSVNPDRPNIFLERPPSLYQEEAYEAVIKPECQRLLNEREEYPHLLFISLQLKGAKNLCQHVW